MDNGIAGTEKGAYRPQLRATADATNTDRSYDGPEPPPMTATAGKAYLGDREPLICRLQREADSYGEQAAKKQRAIELLLIHPEFEDLLELLRIVNIY